MMGGKALSAHDCEYANFTCSWEYGMRRLMREVCAVGSRVVGWCLIREVLQAVDV